jgi:hypothetical protein
VDALGEWTITDHHARYGNGVQQSSRSGEEQDKSGMSIKRNRYVVVGRLSKIEQSREMETWREETLREEYSKKGKVKEKNA